MLWQALFAKRLLNVRQTIKHLYLISTLGFY